MSGQRWTVFYPDFLGRVSAQGDFPRRVRRCHPDTIVIGVINGRSTMPMPVGPELTEPGIFTLETPVTGLAATLDWAYRTISSADTGSVIVRIDPEEHSLERLDQVAATALETGGCIAQADYVGTGLLGDIDRFADDVLFPSTFRHFTQNKLVLSAAHGFQAWRSDLLPMVLTHGAHIWRSADSQRALSWGFDAAMALGALVAGLVPHITHFPAVSPRDRPRQKIVDQFSAVLAVCAAYQRYTAQQSTHE